MALFRSKNTASTSEFDWKGESIEKERVYWSFCQTSHAFEVCPAGPQGGQSDPAEDFGKSNII